MIVEVRENMLNIRPLKPPLVVDVDPELVEKLLREEHVLEEKKYEEVIKRRS